MFYYRTIRLKHHGESRMSNMCVSVQNQLSMGKKSAERSKKEIMGCKRVGLHFIFLHLMVVFSIM